jgi:hypothetical protein
MYIRHRIQKVLLDKSGKEPDADEFPGIAENLKKLAEFNWINAALIAVFLVSMGLTVGNEDE